MRKLFAFISALFVLPLAAQDAGAVRQLQKLTQVYRYLDGLYVDEVDMQPLVESAISGMLEERRVEAAAALRCFSQRKGSGSFR